MTKHLKLLLITIALLTTAPSAFADAGKEAFDKGNHAIANNHGRETIKKWFKIGAEAGHPGAQIAYGDSIFNRRYRNTHDEANYWYQKGLAGYKRLVQAGDVDAKLALAAIYEYARAGLLKSEENRKKGFDLYMQAANSGNAVAQTIIGDYYSDGLFVVKRDYAEAIKWYKKAIKGGNIDAVNSLGFMYLRGRGVKMNLPKAAKLFRKAALEGSVAAQNNLRDMYENHPYLFPK